jgi:hypothetical protein
MSAQMGADLDKLAMGDRQALKQALSDVAKALSDASNYENKVKSKVGSSKSALLEAMRGLPATKAANVTDTIKTVTTVLQTSTAPDLAEIYKALELIDSVIQPNALMDFVDRMGDHINARSAVKIRDINAALDQVNGLRALLDTKV